MSNYLTVLGLVLTISVAAEAKFAPECSDLFVGTTKGIRSSIQSADSLAHFLEGIGEMGAANRETVHGMANSMYRSRRNSEIQAVVASLSSIHRHQAKAIVQTAMIAYARGEASGAELFQHELPRPIDPVQFQRWQSIGQQFQSNAELTAQLRHTLIDLKKFEYVFGKEIAVDLSIHEISAGLMSLKSPSLVGQFIETFQRSDVLTRQYILAKATELRRTPTGEVTLTLKGNLDLGSAKLIESLLKKPLEILQEEAYFEYESNGLAQRPHLTDNAVARRVALRYINRMNFRLTNVNVQHAGRFLASVSVSDQMIDSAMFKLLDSASQLTPQQLEVERVTFALFELQLLERNARGLSSFDIDLQHGHQVLTEKMPWVAYSAQILKLHAKYDLRSGARGFSNLQQIAVNYFKSNPSSLNDLVPFCHDEVLRFRSDFGIAP